MKWRKWFNAIRGLPVRTPNNHLVEWWSPRSSVGLEVHHKQCTCSYCSRLKNGFNKPKLEAPNSWYVLRIGCVYVRVIGRYYSENMLVQKIWKIGEGNV